MKPSEIDQLNFVVEWLEPWNTVPRKFLLTFYPADNSVAMFDIEKRKFFLSRTVCNTVTQCNLFIGNTINVLSRQLKVIDYGDVTTRHIFENPSESTSIIVLMPRAFQHLGQFLHKLNSLKINVKNMRMEKHDGNTVQYIMKWSPRSSELCEVLLESPVIIMELNGVRTSRWREIDEEIPEHKARKTLLKRTKPLLIYPYFSSNVFFSEDQNTVKNEKSLLFSGRKHLGTTTAKFSACSCCIIKPHAVIAGYAGKMIEAIYKAGFNVTALEMFYLTVKEANEFLEVYKGLITDYEDGVEHLASGPCIVMEVQGPCKETVVQDFKKLAGPSDPAFGKALRPKSLRAQFGLDKARNALHCTDLPEDGQLEVEFFFKVLVL